MIVWKISGFRPDNISITLCNIIAWKRFTSNRVINQHYFAISLHKKYSNSSQITNQIFFAIFFYLNFFFFCRSIIICQNINKLFFCIILSNICILYLYFIKNSFIFFNNQVSFTSALSLHYNCYKHKSKNTYIPLVWLVIAHAVSFL